MVELFIMEYLTVLYMAMAFLFMDSRYSRRRTLLIVSGVTLLLMAAGAAPYRAGGTGQKAAVGVRIPPFGPLP